MLLSDLNNEQGIFNVMLVILNFAFLACFTITHNYKQ